MDSPRGGVCSESTHEVKTLSKGVEWCSATTESDLPLRIEQRKDAGGRLMVRIYNKDNNLMEQRG
tara:strand:+ start:1370 stop:1564 length:195 start_codon:yes stop_codon:yes gene_type:complete